MLSIPALWLLREHWLCHSGADAQQVLPVEYQPRENAFWAQTISRKGFQKTISNEDGVRVVWCAMAGPH